MKVVDHKPQCWFLLEHERQLYLDANCNHGAFGYSVLIQLNATEFAEYETEGQSFLSALAREIDASVPILEASASAYKGRDVSTQHAAAITAAVQEWKSAR